MAHKAKSKMIDFNINISKISLNINGLNIMIKRHRLSDWKKRQTPTTCSL